MQFNIDPIFGYPSKKPKKRNITYGQKIWCWENNSHKCHVCNKRVGKISEAEFDHKRAYAKGGATTLSNVKITHRFCNRLKGKKSLSEIRKQLGIKSKIKRKRTKRKRRTNDIFDVSIPRINFKF